MISETDVKLNYAIKNIDEKSFTEAILNNASIISSMFQQRVKSSPNPKIQAMITFVLATDKAGISRETAAAILQQTQDPAQLDICAACNEQQLLKILEKSSENASGMLL